MTTRSWMVGAALAAALAAAPARAQCGEWADDLEQGLDLYTWSLAVIDDGTGPALYAGGDFQNASGQKADSVARWNGSAFEAVGVPPTRGVQALVGFDDGAGFRIWIGTQDTFIFQTSGVWAWDGTSWTSEGDTDAVVKDLVVFDDGSGPALYAGGNFNSIDGLPISNLARRAGGTWEPVGTGAPKAVNAMAVWDDGSGPALYTAGNSGLARWDGAEWRDVPGSFGAWLVTSSQVQSVQDVHVHDDGGGATLYVAGNFRDVTPGAGAGVARWNGTEWEALGPEPDEPVACLATFDTGEGRGPRLIAGGNFKTLGGVAAKRIAAWDGSSWEPLAGGGFSATALGLQVFDDGSGWPELWAVGRFKKAGGQPSKHVGRWENPCAGEGTSYCTAGTTASGCSALIASTGAASRSAASGFDVSVAGTEGGAPGLFFFGTTGEQALPWGNGTSWRCVAPPLQRTGLLSGAGTAGQCDGSLQLDFNAWMGANPSKAPPGGAAARMQCWFRDPASTSNQTTSLSDALRFTVLP